MADAIFNEAKDKMHKAAENLQRNLGQIRAGRANASLLDRVQVTYYGVPTPLNQMASITIPEARVLMITPFDKSMVQEVLFGRVQVWRTPKLFNIPLSSRRRNESYTTFLLSSCGKVL